MDLFRLFFTSFPTTNLVYIVFATSLNKYNFKLVNFKNCKSLIDKEANILRQLRGKISLQHDPLA